jgi:large subunit ribosomal protein L2
MPVKIYKPTSPARRKTSVVDYGKLSKKVRPPKFLRGAMRKTGGRNNLGRITTRHHGGGMKQLYRVIDFRQDKLDIPGVVQTLEYDPIRTGFIVLVAYADGEKRYHLAWEGAEVGQKISSGENIEPTIGSRMPLRNIPTGSEIFNVEMKHGRGGQIVRSAGSSAILQEVEGGFAHLKMPSSEVRLVQDNCWASIGKVSNGDHRNERIGAAGRNRRLGIRPSVRGKAMNPVDHPHGGGEGHNPIGLRHPKTPWGKNAFGVKTRNRKKYSNRLIIQRRKKK